MEFKKAESMMIPYLYKYFWLSAMGTTLSLPHCHSILQYWEIQEYSGDTLRYLLRPSKVGLSAWPSVTYLA